MMHPPEARPTPLVRATRSQAEIDLLPPFGVPEVSLKGELVVYALVAGSLSTLYLAVNRRRSG